MAMILETIVPHGMCTGVTNAIAAAAKSRGAFCLHSLVHNEMVLGELAGMGCKFVDDVEQVPDGAVVVFPAHGVTPEVRRRAAEKGLETVDATCPFVARAHRAAREFSRQGLPVVVLGDRDHAEVVGILGEIADKREPKPGERIVVVSQTTMNADEVAAEIGKLGKKYVVAGVSDICVATKERQDAVKRFDGDAIVVLGSRSSANTRRLLEVARCPAFLAEDMRQVARLRPQIAKFGRVGVTSGASTPERFFEDAVRLLRGVPAHLAIIMDGNGRWAERRGKPRSFGHSAGARTLAKALGWIFGRGVRYVTVYAFSTENWKRPAGEVAGLMRLFSAMLRSQAPALVENGIKLRVAGRRDALPPSLRKAVSEVEGLTAAFGKQLTVCINYGGRAEIVDAANALMARGEPATEDNFRRFLYEPDVPDPDLIVRTGGERRTSNFLLWESAYAEYHFTDTLWPDFSEKDLDAAIADYATRERRKGGLA